MLDLPRYLLGVAELGLILGFATLAAIQLRRWLLPDFAGAPAYLATSVLAMALLLWTAELLGSFGWFELLPYLLAVGLIVIGMCWWRYAAPAGGAAGRPTPEEASATAGGGGSPAATGPAGLHISTLGALLIATAASVHFAAEAKVRLGTGMTGFDSTWYHGPFAAGFLQSGSTWDLHFIAPQFLAWFYPANSEIFHAIGMLAFDRDVLSPLLNLGWLVGCLLAAWCIGRPYGVASWSLALAAVALSVPALSDQAGEARNDIVGIFFLLAAIAIALNARERSLSRIPRQNAFALPALAVSGLAAGLAAGTKLNFLLPAAIFVVGLAFIAPRGARWRAFVATCLGALAGGGYWYLRNLIHTGNPLPWIDSIGPISLPAPDQALGGREGHSVLGYLTDGAVWSEWFLPGLHDGLWIVWPLLVAAAFAGLSLCIGRRATPALRLAGFVGLAALLAWLIAPTSASGPDGMPRGFESGLRYLVPALVLGLALLPAALSAVLPTPLRGIGEGIPPNGRILKAPSQLARRLSGRGDPLAYFTVLVAIVVGLGYPIQRHYLDSRYADPAFTTPGLNAAFKWSRDISGAGIATTSTRQYPLFGADLSNRVEFVGVERPHGGFVAPSTCRAWRRLLNAGDYDYVVASRDRVEPGKPPYPPTARWTAAPNSKIVLRVPPTIVYQLNGLLDPSACR
jgi:hypothetical protein